MWRHRRRRDLQIAYTHPTSFSILRRTPRTSAGHESMPPRPATSALCLCRISLVCNLQRQKRICVRVIRTTFHPAEAVA
ncbi:Os03g0276000 [Oryza sativa Japonica Group]|uniref:Os03g0276000 protein n=1 Tax=Oryza sativa subsp. japonica TaxID=39947 RepID=A0A0P0VWL2_ORYSJ|nr:Os03g0276000 [Oryza sativa Japonica Group]